MKVGDIVARKSYNKDIVFKITDIIVDENGKKIRGDMHNVGISLSSEYGRKKMIDDKGWYIEP